MVYKSHVLLWVFRKEKSMQKLLDSSRNSLELQCIIIEDQCGLRKSVQASKSAKTSDIKYIKGNEPCSTRFWMMDDNYDDHIC